jgi:hypothetical protein
MQCAWQTCLKELNLKTEQKKAMPEQEGGMDA